MDEFTRKKFETTIRELKGLPDHDSGTVAAMASRMRTAGYRAFATLTGREFLAMTADDVRKELEQIAEATPEELKKNPTPQEKWGDSSPESVQTNRFIRFEFLMREYRNLYILRNSPPGVGESLAELKAE
jgi:hypothetical protein